MLEGESYAAVTAICERVTHDFNNLMLPMIAYPPLLKRELKDDRRGGPLVDAIEQAAEAMLHIDQQLMALLPDSGEMCSSMDVTECADSAAKAVAGKDLPGSVEVVVSGACPLLARGSPTKVKRAADILIRNALEAMVAKGGGRILVETGAVDLPAMAFDGMPERAGRWARLRVSDTGEGFDISAGQRLFEPFHTTRRSGTRRGAGLGLSIAYRIAVDHGGWITFSIPDSGGAAFALYLPLAGDTQT
jgi:signal transduction histidine kinase